ncbi:hypothetical protein HY501_02290 [Candidatus Woesearchaeota archaeon]|nr:hypothetical protein [Candidatus Woesearchaeota archaeon]
MVVKKPKQHALKQQSNPVKGTEAIHILIQQPKVLRKEVLSLAIEALQLLKHYEKVKLLREQKFSLLLSLKKEMDLIRKMVHELDVSDFPLSLEEVRKHPRFKVHDEVVEHAPEHGAAKVGEHHKAEHHKPVARKHEMKEERDKLEEDMEELQRKLDSL